MISKHIFHFSPVGFRTLSALTLLVLMTVASGASAERLRLVTEEWPSLIDDTGEGPAGILWEVTREVLTNMGHEATVEFVPWKRAQRMVLEGKRDGIIGIGLNDERKRQYRFPHEHLLLSETVVVSRKSHIVVFSGLESLAGLQIGVSPGYVYSGEIQNATGFERIAIPGIDSGLRMLMLGRIDAMLSNRYVVMAEAERLGLTGKIAMSATPVSGGPVYLTFRRDMPENFVVNFSNALKLYKTANLIADRPSSGL